MTKLSIVTTMYFSEPYIEEFYSRILKSIENITSEVEIVFVNDGSPDNSKDLVLNLRKKDKRVKLIDLTRNFGHHRAILTGLLHSTGERVFLIDCDLEESPELIHQFWGEMEACQQLDAVYGVQNKRKGGFFEKFSGHIFYKVYNFLSDVQIPENFLTIRLMSRRFVDEICRYDERIMQFAVLTELVGLETKAIEIEKLHKGQTTYTMTKKIAHATDGITSTSVKPLSWIFRLGLFTTLVSVLYVGYVLFNAFTHGTPVGGWTSLIISIWFIGGVLMASVGIIGVYVAKIFLEVKKRPLVSIKDIYWD